MQTNQGSRPISAVRLLAALVGIAAGVRASPAQHLGHTSAAGDPSFLVPDECTDAPDPAGWSLRPAPAADNAFARCFSEDSVLSPQAIQEWERRAHLGQNPYAARYFANDTWNWNYDPNSPVYLTYSYVADNTLCDIDGSFKRSTLLESMDAKFGSRELWTSYIQACFDSVSRICGVRFARANFSPNGVDDGAAWPSSSGSPGRRGDIRICGSTIVDNVPGLNTLAFAYFPSSSGEGDMCIDVSEGWENYADAYRFLRNVFTHELGHALGLDHVCPLQHTKLMEPIYSSSFDALQHDDILALQYLYGDPQEPNNNAASATVFVESQPNTSIAFFTYGQVPNTATASVLPGDQDWIRSSLAAQMPVTFTATPVGASYDSSSQGPQTPENNSGCTSGHFVNSRLQSGLRVEIRGASGTILASAQGGPGQPVTVSAQVPGGNYYSVVYPVSTSFNMPQMYTLTRTIGAPQPPINNPWYEGILLGQLPYGMTISGTTFGATTDGSALIEPGGTIGTQDVYYNFNPWDGPGRMRVTVTGGANVVSVHRLVNSAPSPSNQWTPINANGGANGVVDVNITEIVPCVIRVAVAPGGIPGPHTVSVRYIDGPTNDSCLTPVDITSGAYNGTTIFARPEPSPYPSSCTTDMYTLPWGAWYRFVATTQGTLSPSVCNANNTILGVYQGCPAGGGVLVACNDNAPSCGNGGSALSLPVVAGQEYLVRVSHFQNLSGNFTLNVAFTRDGESCPIAIPISAGNTAFSNAGYATDETSCYAGANRWYLYTASGYSTVNVNTCTGTNYDSSISAWNACPSAGGTLLACNDDWCGLQSSISFQSYPGQQFYISIGGYAGNTGSGIINISETPIPGEVCSTPILVTDGSYPFSTLGHYTDGPAEPNCNFCCGDPQVHGDLWYLYFATATGTLHASTCGSDYDSKMTAYASCPTGDGQAIACADDECGVQAVLTMPVVEGTPYLIRLGGYGGWTGTGTLVISVTHPCPADFNQDGGIDGADVEFFFAAWGAGDTSADVNTDGGIDGADVEYFFAQWETGAC
ncbi:MAG: matrixin family metalloprotease [Planctomycetes bacterium]|nr:matrixin family metalloprotease [Planctomycetota bacterium]